MRRALLVVLLAFSLLAVFFARVAWGADFSSVSVFTDNRCAICFLPSYLLHINVDIQDPLGLDDITSIVAAPFSGSVPGPINLQFSPPASPGNIFSFDNLTGTGTILDPKNPPTGVYNITLNTKAGGTQSILTHNLDNPQQLPFATNFALSDHSATPTVTFTQPAVTIPPGYQIKDQLRIVDLTHNTEFYRTPRTFFESGNASFPVPPGVLSVDQTYLFQLRVTQGDLNDPGTAILDNLENRSLKEVQVTTLPATPPAAGPLPGGAASSFVKIDAPGATNTFAVGINNAGQITGSRGNGQGFLLSGGTSSVVNFPSAARTNPQDINNSGVIVGQYLDAFSKVHGFSAEAPYTPANFASIDVPFPGARGNSTNGINDAGKIVGGYTDASGAGHGFLKDGTAFSTIDPPGAKNSFAGGINNTDQIVGSYRDLSGVVHGYFKNGATFSVIDVPGAFGTEAFKLNNAGQVAGIYLDANAQVHGFLESRQGIFNTMDPIKLGATLDNTFGFSGALIPTGAFGLNDAGQMVGAFQDANGDHHGYLSTPTTLRAMTPTGTCGGVPCNVWISAFHPSFTSVNGVNALDIGVNVFLTGDPPTDPVSGKDLKQAWQNGVQTIWGGSPTQPRMFVVDPKTGKQYALAFDLNFVNDPSQADFNVTVHSGSARDSLANWSALRPGGYAQDCVGGRTPELCGYQGFLIAHEYGHMLGLFDEYVGGALDPSGIALCTNQAVGTPPRQGIMAEINQNATPYACPGYYHKILDDYLAEQGFALAVNANAPLFPDPPVTDLILGPDTEGAPDSLAPVPEPSPALLMPVGLAIVAAYRRWRKTGVSSATV